MLDKAAQQKTQYICHRCKRKGHFQCQCKYKKTIDSITTSDIPEESDNAFLGTIHSTSSHTTEWLVELHLNEVPITFKIDTGAKVTAIPEAMATPFKALIRKFNRTLLGPGMNSLNVCGQFTATLKQKSNRAKEKIFIVRDLYTPLVGFPAINALNLVAKVCDITTSKEAILV